jgi:hypothetical protein
VKLIPTIVAACAAIGAAAGFQVQGNLSEAWPKSSLGVQTVAAGSKLWFTLPPRSGVTVVTKPDTGAAVTVRLNMSATVNLPFPSTYQIVVTRDSGEGQWTCKDAVGGPILLGFGTSIDAKRHARVTYVADDQKETWTFAWPKEATFVVRVFNLSGKVVQEQDLYDSSELELFGGGSFTFEVVPTDGSGEFMARKSQ